MYDDVIRGTDGTTLDPVKHRYYDKNGNVKAPVSKYIRYLGLSDYRDIDPYFADRGSRIHKLCEMELRGQLNREMIEPDEEKYFKAFEMWWQDKQAMGWTFLDAEIVLSNKYYGGCIDALFLNEKGEHILVDWKTSAKLVKWMKLQVEAYAMLLGKVGIVPKERRIVQLKNDGTFDEQILGTEYQLIWKQLLHIARQKRPVSQKMHLARMCMNNVYACDIKYAEITKDLIEAAKNTENDMKKAKELLIKSLGDETRSGICELPGGKVLRVERVHQAVRESVNLGAFFDKVNANFDKETIKLIRKYWATSKEYKVTAGYHKFVIEDIQDEAIQIDYHIRSKRTPSEVADYLTTYYDKNSILAYLRSEFGPDWTTRNYAKLGNDIHKLITHCIQDARAILDLKNVDYYTN